MEPNILHIKKLSSTNDFLKSLHNSSTLKQPFCVYTDHQTEGRGQRGNRWISEPNKNLLCSFLVDNNVKPEQFRVLNFVAAVAILNTLKTLGLHQIKIKWPNDVYIGDMKIAGTLVENVFEGSKPRFSVVGIGLNVNQMEFGDLSACSLCSLSSEQFEIKDVLLRLYTEFYQQLENSSDELIDFVNSHLYKRGRAVTFLNNKEYKEYKLLKLNVNGNLVVESSADILEIEHHNYKWVK